MSFSAGPSPLWLGVIAISSFGGLVMAAFASGYHLVEDPRAVSALASAAPGAAGARPALVRALAADEQAVVRSRPGGGEVLGQLSAEQPVSILAEQAGWVRIRYEQGGEAREGWLEAVSLSATER